MVVALDKVARAIDVHRRGRVVLRAANLDVVNDFLHRVLIDNGTLIRA